MDHYDVFTSIEHENSLPLNPSSQRLQADYRRCAPPSEGGVLLAFDQTGAASPSLVNVFTKSLDELSICAIFQTIVSNTRLKMKTAAKSPDKTRKAILDAAERLFAEKGFEGASVRRITSDAGVNIAAANYHFGSKEDLLRAALARRIGPVNEERLRLLATIETKTGKQSPKVEKVLEALVAPALRLSRDKRRGGRVFMKLLGRIFADPGDKLQALFLEQFEDIGKRFMPAFHRALPDLPPVELMWRMHFVIGVMAHTMADTQKLKHISQGACDPNDTEGIVDRMVTFLAAGMQAPFSKGRKR